MGVETAGSLLTKNSMASSHEVNIAATAAFQVDVLDDHAISLLPENLGHTLASQGHEIVSLLELVHCITCERRRARMKRNGRSIDTAAIDAR